MEPTIKKTKIVRQSYAKIHNFFDEGEVEENGRLNLALENIVSFLDKEKMSGKLQINFIDKSTRSVIVLNLSSAGEKLTFNETKDFSFNIVIRNEETLIKIIKGDISPIYAIAKGMMRIRGELNFGLKVYKSLAADDGIIDPCLTN